MRPAPLLSALKTPEVVSSVASQEMKPIVAPDFYWQFRLNRLAEEKKDDLPFNAANYPDVSGSKDLYDAYYLDLTLQGKLEGFDWEQEKKISDSEWLTVYKDISKWTEDVAKTNKPDHTNLPANDFDLLKQFYPQLNFRDLETKFSEEEVGTGFKYQNMKEMLQAAMDGNLDVPGYTKDISNLESTKARNQLAALKESTMNRLDQIQAEAMAYATNPFIDEEAREHYKALKAKLGSFPQTKDEWAAFRAKMEAQVDEMAKLASKADSSEHGLSPEEEFKNKYGKSLEEMNERMSKFKADPNNFLEDTIKDSFSQKGLDVWKKSESFSQNVISEADKAAAEKAFAEFLEKA
jgi:predicted lactoylglutathione lyase